MNYSELDLIILKELISNKNHALDFVSDCDSSLFQPECWNAAHIIISYIKTYKEIPTLKVLTEKLQKGNNKVVDYLKNVWQEIENVNSISIEFKFNVEKIKKRFAEKQIILAKDNLLKFESGMDITVPVKELQKTVQSIKNLNKIKTFTKMTLKDYVPIFREEYNAKLNDPNFDAGILTGYSFLDSATDGLRPGEMLLIAAESGGGKSMLLMNMAVQIWLQSNSIEMESNWNNGYNILYFSLEMPYKLCTNRILARLSGVPTKKIKKANLNAEQATKLKKALRFISKYPYQFDIIDLPRGATIQTIEQIYEETKNFYTPHIVVIDYIGLMEYESNSLDDWLKLGKISESCHEFGRVHNCNVLSAVQLNRVKGKEIEDRVGLHRIGRSGLIMHNADIGIQINKRANEENYSDMEAYLIKLREGPLNKGRFIKNMACASLLDDKQEEDYNNSTEAFDISEQAEALDI